MKNKKNNTGENNTGNGNSGYGNSGNWNSGDGNSTNREGGIFCEAWANFWRDTDEANRKKFLALPNFSWDVFTEITGIKPDHEMKDCEGKVVKIDGKKYKLTAV